MKRALAALLLLLAPLPALAESVVAGLSQNRVAITANFDGSEILIFGAVKREVPSNPDPALQVIVTVAGPSTPLTVRRKARQAGIWINSNALEIDHAPSFYAVATSAPLGRILSETEDVRHRISIDQAIRFIGAKGISDSQAFTDALVRIRSREGLYQLDENVVKLEEDTLFSTSVALPANLTEGVYTARIFLTRGRAVVDVHQTEIIVRKVGLERFVFNLAHEHPLLYGLLALAIAAGAGWGASVIFRFIRT